jgi:hypothetical protein
MLVLSYVRLSICMKKSQNHICAFIRTIKVTCSDIKFDTYITGTPPPSKKKQLWKHIWSMKPKKERGPFNQIGLTNSHG